jgi:hypothetical protein
VSGEQALSADAALTQRYLLDFPHEAARLFEAMRAAAVALLSQQAPHAVSRPWQALTVDVACNVLELLPDRWRGTCWPRPSRWPAWRC